MSANQSDLNHGKKDLDANRLYVIQEGGKIVGTDAFVKLKLKA